MRKVFRPHIVLCTAGRLFTFILIVVPLFMLCVFAKFAFFSGVINYEFIPLILFAIGLNILVWWLMGFLWQQIWGKLILDENKIIWRCMFCPKVEIEYADIKLVAVRNFGNRNVVHVDIYKTGFQFILITTKTLPTLPIDKVKCKRGVIKWAKSDAVCKALLEVVPANFCNTLK